MKGKCKKSGVIFCPFAFMTGQFKLRKVAVAEERGMGPEKLFLECYM